MEYLNLKEQSLHDAFVEFLRHHDLSFEIKKGDHFTNVELERGGIFSDVEISFMLWDDDPDVIHTMIKIGKSGISAKIHRTCFEQKPAFDVINTQLNNNLDKIKQFIELK